MNEEDAVYAALLTQLLSDSDTSILDDRVHSWIRHQYDFVFSENQGDDNCGLHASDSRAPSPSPSSSVGAHRSFDFDNPDVSAYLPSLYTGRTTPHDSTWLFPRSHPYTLTEEEEYEEQDHTHSLKSLKQEMSHRKMQSTPPTSHIRLDKDLPAPPPSPASSLKRPPSSRTLRSRSSSGRMSRLPSLTSTLSSDQTQTQESYPPLPSPVAHTLSNINTRKRSGSFPHKFLRLQDDKNSLYPSPTVSDFSLAHSRETALTTPCISTPASPTSPTFAFTPCSPENVALPASPLNEQGFFREQARRGRNDQSHSSPTSPVLPKTSIPVSPSTTSLVSGIRNVSPISCSPPMTNINSENGVTQRHRTDHSQSHWSVTTESSLKPVPSELKGVPFSTPRTPVAGDKDEEAKTSKKGTRFLSLIARLAPGRINTPSALTATRKTVLHSATELNTEQSEEKPTQKKAFGKGLSSSKASLASIRTSFSLSRTSFTSHRPSISPTNKERQPLSLPTSPIQTSYGASAPSLVDGCVTPLNKKSSLASLRASFSLSRTSFGSLVSPTEEVPPLPTSPGHGKTSFSTSRPSLTDGTTTNLNNKSYPASLSASVTLSRASPLPPSPTRTSFSVTRPSFTDGSATSEAVPPVPKVSLPKVPSRITQIDTALPPLQQSLSKFSPCQVSFSETLATSASASPASLSFSTTNRSASGTSSVPPPSKRMSLASAAGIERSVSTSSMPTCETQIPTKPILRLTAKPGGPRMPLFSSPRLDRKATPPQIAVPGKTDFHPSAPPSPKVLQAPTKFTPPAKLAFVIEARSERLAPAVASSISVSAQPARASKLPTPIRYMSKGQATPRAMTVENALPRKCRKLPVPTSDEDAHVENARISVPEGIV